MIEALQQFVADFPTWLQWLGVALISAIPFVESYNGSIIGVIVGVPPVIAIPAAVLGNALSVLVVVLVTAAIRRAARRRSAPKHDLEAVEQPEKPASLFSRSGLPVVTILGQLTLCSQAVAIAQVGKGAKLSRVLFWQFVSIVIWAKAFGIVASIILLA